MAELIDVIKSDKKPDHKRSDGKSDTWLGDFEVHFSLHKNGKGDITESTVEYSHYDAICSDDYGWNYTDDLEVYDFASHVEKPNTETVYVLKGEWHGRWFEVGGIDYGYEWDAKFWFEKEAIIQSYPYEVDGDGYVLIQMQEVCTRKFD